MCDGLDFSGNPNYRIPLTLKSNKNRQNHLKWQNRRLSGSLDPAESIDM